MNKQLSFNFDKIETKDPKKFNSTIAEAMRKTQADLNVTKMEWERKQRHVEDFFGPPRH